jgi:hypothetical protein
VTFFRRSSFKQTANPLLDGAQILMVSISLLVWAALWLVVVPISLLLTTLTRNKKPNNFDPKCSNQHGSGFSQAQSSD